MSQLFSGKDIGKFDTTSFQEIILSSGVFRSETASGFYPWGKVDSFCERVAEELCGWRHGNSFPMTQNAQSHHQMRSIPRCSKAVFYVFVFDSIHDSATMHNLIPRNFPLNPNFPTLVDLLTRRLVDFFMVDIGNLCIFVEDNVFYTIT